MKAFDYRNRTSLRKVTEPLDVSDIYFMDKGNLAVEGKIIDISSTGMLMQIERKKLDKRYKKEFELSDLVGEQLYFQIEAMALEVDGVITRIRSIGGGKFEVAIDYSAGAPEYWRECLVELLPTLGEEEEEFDPFVDDDWIYE